MKMIQHSDNLWQLTRFGAFSCYFVREPDGLTLVDTNLQGSATGILKSARTLGLPITRIILTHAHGDHAGSLDDVAKQLPNAEIAFTARTAQFLRGELTLLPDEPQAKLRGSFVKRTTQPARVVAEGDVIGSLCVIAAPGHSPDLVALWDARDGTLVAGDAFQTQAGIAVAGITRWLFPFPAMATWHLPTALQSARKLRNLQPARLVVGHGPVLEQPLAAMDMAIAEAARKIMHTPAAGAQVNETSISEVKINKVEINGKA